MINVRKILVLCTLLAPNAITFAASDTAEINLNLNYIPYVKLIGTAPDSTRYYSNSTIAQWIFPSVVDLGTLGLESNLSGSCNINFSTNNNFRLRHTVSNNSLTKYKIIYRSQDFSATSNPTLSLPCSSLPTAIQFKPTQLVIGNFLPGGLLMQAGVYQDVVHITVESQ